MRSGSAASGRMRLAAGLTVAGAALLITGLLMAFVGEALRLESGHGGHGLVSAGELIAACGLGTGAALLVALAVGRPDRDRGGRGRRGRGRGVQAVARLDAAGEWLSQPPRAAAGHGVLPPWPEPAGEGWPASEGYADDGWQPESGDGWSPGPADARDPRRDGGWEPAGGGGWEPAGGGGWEPAGTTAWSSDDRRMPGRSGLQPPYPAGPQPADVAGPEPERAASPEPSYLAGPQAALAARPTDGYPPAPPAPRHAAPRYAGAPGTFSTEATNPGAPAPHRMPADDVTSPIPVIGGTGQHSPEPARSEPALAAEPVAGGEPASTAAQEKLNQIKDLYLTAEAIGEDALGKHFDQLSQRQRALIREYFERAGLRPAGEPAPSGDHPAQDGAPRPGRAPQDDPPLPAVRGGPARTDGTGESGPFTRRHGAAVSPAHSTSPGTRR